MNSLPDLIFVSMEEWDTVWRRNQFVVAGLSRRYPAMKVLFVGLPRDLTNDIRHRRLSALGRPATWNVPDLPNITVTHPWKLLPNSSRLGRRFNERLARDHVRRVAQEVGLRDPILWLNPHYAVHMAGQMGERAVIYDITDDWTTLTQSEAMRLQVREQDAALCLRADEIIVCSGRLRDLKSTFADKVHLIPNGVDAGHYARVLDGSRPLPHRAAGWKKPVLGYTGTLHSDRIDLTLIEQISRQWDDGSIVLIGPDFLTSEDAGRLGRRANIHRTGPISYSEIPNYMRGFDVCITPHRVTAFTESLNPIKLWEYLASGKPIVSTPVAGFRDYPRFVRLADDARAFVAAARAAGREDPACREERRAEARRHSWNSRLDDIERILRAHDAPGRKAASHAG